jgi:hypothetical protein
MAYPSPLHRLWDPIIDRDWCAEVDGLERRCQLVVGHAGQHLLQPGGQRYTWQVGAEQVRPAFAPGGFPRDEN